MKKDILEKLNNYVAGNSPEYTMIVEAANTITNLRNALHSIGYDYVELSHDKVQWLYHEHMKIAKKAYQDSFPPEEKTEPKPLDNNF